MSVFDDLKGKAQGLKEKAGTVIGDNQDKIQSGIEKGGDFIDEKTGGKYSERINGVQEKATGYVESAGNDNDNPKGTDQGA